MNTEAATYAQAFLGVVLRQFFKILFKFTSRVNRTLTFFEVSN